MQKVCPDNRCVNHLRDCLQPCPTAGDERCADNRCVPQGTPCTTAVDPAEVLKAIKSDSTGGRMVFAIGDYEAAIQGMYKHDGWQMLNGTDLVHKRQVAAAFVDWFSVSGNGGLNPLHSFDTTQACFKLAGGQTFAIDGQMQFPVAASLPLGSAASMQLKKEEKYRFFQFRQSKQPLTAGVTKLGVARGAICKTGHNPVILFKTVAASNKADGGPKLDFGVFRADGAGIPAGWQPVGITALR